MGPSESPTGTILSEQTLPSFSSAHSQIGNINNTDGFYINSQSGFALPPLENTFNFENVDLEDSPAWKKLKFCLSFVDFKV